MHRQRTKGRNRQRSDRARPWAAVPAFSYNGLSARVSQSGASGTRTYRRDGADVLAPVIADGSATYVPGVSERRAGSTRALHLDRLGSAHRQTDSAGTLAASVQRDAFGGALAGGFGTWQGPYAFAGAWGYEEDGDTGLVHVGHRLYDPSLGRFLTQDPIQDGRNWYAYCDSNPLKAIDPTGLVSWGLIDWDEVNRGKVDGGQQGIADQFRDNARRLGFGPPARGVSLPTVGLPPREPIDPRTLPTGVRIGLGRRRGISGELILRPNKEGDGITSDLELKYKQGQLQVDVKFKDLFGSGSASVSVVIIFRSRFGQSGKEQPPMKIGGGRHR